MLQIIISTHKCITKQKFDHDYFLDHSSHWCDIPAFYARKLHIFKRIIS